MYNIIQIETFYNCIQYMADSRLVVVLFPLLAAASWALFNIGRVALQQLKRMS